MTIRKFIKYTFIILLNLLFVIALFFAADYAVFKVHDIKFNKDYAPLKNTQNYNHFYRYENLFHRYIYEGEDFFNGADNISSGRLPSGTEYKDKPPVIIFGCSIAYGQYLPPDKTPDAVISRILKRTVYNRGIPGTDYAHMLYQVRNDDFYNTVQDADTVIYVLPFFHTTRALRDYFDIVDRYIMFHYNYKNGELYEKNYTNRFVNFLRSFYIYKLLNHIYVDKFLENPANFEKATDEEVLYFTSSKDELEKHFNHKVNFIVFFFDYPERNKVFDEMIQKKLNDKGFITVRTSDFTDKYEKNEIWEQPGNAHPTEYAWEFFASKLAKFIEEHETDENN